MEIGLTISNTHVQPYLRYSLQALRLVDHLPGVETVLARIADGNGDGNLRGATFEIIASAALKDRLKALSVDLGGNEVDGLLSDGTIVEMKSYKHGHYLSPLEKARKQLLARCQGKSPALLVIKHLPNFC